ncbi:MAG: cytochrome c [Acidimicrobiales bacterium]
MRAAIAAIAMAFIIVLLAGAAAATAEVDVDAPSEVTVGQEVVISATITESGEVVAGGEAALAFVGRIGGESDWVVVATGTTDETGTVTFEYSQKALDAERMRVEYFGPDGRENTEFELVVVDGPQLVRSDAGADIPILGVWWILVVLLIVWVLITLAVTKLVRVGKSSDLPGGPRRVIPLIMVGFVVFTALGMFLVVISKPQSHANLDPTNEFGRTPTAIVGGENEYVGLSSGNLGEGRESLDGQEIFVRSGCASCHGVNGSGALVGGPIIGEHSAGSVGALIETVREGPGGMPSINEEALTDEEIAKIFAYLETQ